jgi:RNA polymerase sigma-70 factor (ECF subfamily)
MSQETQPLTPEYVAAMHLAHGEELKRFLLGVLRDAATAADCLQATFTKLLERGHESRPETRRAWLFRVAFQEAMLAKRKAATGDRVLRKAAWSLGLQSREPQSEQPDAPALRQEAIQRVKDALQLLPAEQRQVVWMRIYEEKTFATIATELNIPLGTALGRMRTALIKLRRVLE